MPRKKIPPPQHKEPVAQAQGRLSKEQVLGRMREGVYLEDPALWAPDALGVQLDPWQQRCPRKLFLGDKHRLSVRAGHGVGKSYTAAMLCHQFLSTFVPSKVIVSGPTGRQTRSQFWSYLSVLWQRSVFKDDIEWLKTKMFFKGAEEEWFALWVSSKNSKNIEGYHGPLDGRNLLWIIEEAKGVEDQVFEALSGALSQEDCYLYISSTCGPPSGHMWASHTSLTHLYDTEHVPSTESSRVSPEQIARWREQWGEDSPVFQARVMAEFPEENDRQLVNLSWLSRAVEPPEDDLTA